MFDLSKMSLGDVNTFLQSAGFNGNVDLNAAAADLQRCVINAAQAHAGNDFASGNIGGAGQGFISSEITPEIGGWSGALGNISVGFANPIRPSIAFKYNGKSVNAIQVLDGGMAVGAGKHAPFGALNYRGASNFLQEAADMFKATCGEKYNVIDAWAE